jgi:hypothetical protein
MHDLITAAIQDADEEILDEPTSEEALDPESPRIAELGGTPIPDDGAEEVRHDRSPYIQERFALLLSLWCEHVGISRSQYAPLLQILLTLEDVRPIRILPSTLSTLKRRFKAQFPILPLRRKKIPVVSAKLPTLSAAERQLVTSTTCWLYFQDPISLFSNMIKSPIFRESMHVGMAHFVDEPSELWESLSWASSNRSTSGVFARYSDGLPVFVSDIVNYRCRGLDCSCAGDDQRHIGRVQAVAKDFSSHAISPGAVTILVQPYIQFQHASDELKALLTRKRKLPFAENELVIHETLIRLQEVDIVQRVSRIWHDYKFGSMFSKRIGEPANKTFVRRVINEAATLVRPICQLSPSRGQLEMRKYGRSGLLRMFENTNCISVPYQLFIDGFGVYRNMYRSIMGIYMIPACLSAADRAKPVNIYPITLGPHGSNFRDVIASLQRLSVLDKGLDIKSNSRHESTTVIAFCMAFLGDMPQQQDNSGFRRPTAARSCRNCLIHNYERADLEYDIHKYSRFHFETQNLRSHIQETPVRKRNGELKKYGVSADESPLFTIAPCLNLDTFFPSDPCHSEYSGISKLAHSLLVDAILSPRGREEYAWQLRRFQFPFGWGRLQSPVHHLESYQLQEHARASVILPLLLRCCLQKSWIATAYWSALSKMFTTTASALETIVQVFVAIAKSNTILVSRKICLSDRSNLLPIIRTARQGLQLLLEIAAIATEAVTSRRGRSQLLSEESTSRDMLPGINLETPSKRAKEFRAIKQRPNMHIGLHYPRLAEEYGVPNNSNVLAGENKHRYLYILSPLS